MDVLVALGFTLHCTENGSDKVYTLALAVAGGQGESKRNALYPHPISQVKGFCARKVRRFWPQLLRWRPGSGGYLGRALSSTANHHQYLLGAQGVEQSPEAALVDRWTRARNGTVSRSRRFAEKGTISRDHKITNSNSREGLCNDRNP